MKSINLRMKKGSHQPHKANLWLLLASFLSLVILVNTNSQLQAKGQQASDSTSGYWQRFEDFNSLSNGPINNQNGWKAGSSIVVTTDPDNSHDKVMAVSGKNQSVSKSLQAFPLSDYEDGILFFRMRRSNDVDIFAGISDIDEPTNFSDFKVQFGSQSATGDKFTARNGDQFETVGNGFRKDTWYCVWLTVIDQNYYISLLGGQYTSRTGFDSDDSDSRFSFRNETDTSNLPLKSFFARTGQDSDTMYIDDIYLHDGVMYADGQPGGDCPSDDGGGWKEIDDFESLNIGNINDQNGWSGENGITVATDPGNNNNKVMKLSGTNNSIYKTLQNPLTNDMGYRSLFFRMRRSGNPDAFGGLSDVSQPSAFSDYEVQFGAQSAAPGDFRLRYANSFGSIQSVPFEEDSWYCVWLMVSNRNDDFNIYLLGGDLESPRWAGEYVYFRNAGPNHQGSLKSFFSRTGATGGTLYIDDIFIDVSVDNISIPQGSCSGSDDGTATPPTPTATASPEPTSTPQATQTSEPTASPEATQTPEVTATLEATSSPQATQTPEVTTTLEATPSPEATTSPAATPSPQATQQTPEVTTTLEATSSPEATTSPAATPSPEVSPTPEIIPIISRLNLSGESVSLQVEVNGDDDQTFAFSAENLPEGIDLDSQTGMLTGQVAQPQTADVTITVIDNFGRRASIQFKWVFAVDLAELFLPVIHR